MEKYFSDFWNDYSYIHNATKKLYILIEEYDDELSSFIQPIKEQRDALEHIVRAYNKFYCDKDSHISKIDEQYIKGNLSKALGHNFRAFFDCADILSIIIREKLSLSLSDFSYSEILSAWSDYEEKRLFLEDVPDKFAKLRTSKDVVKTSEDKVKMVDEYTKLIRDLMSIYKDFIRNIYPKLNKK